MCMTVVGNDFIFIHVPKCAGKSITRRLGGATRNIPAHVPLSYFDAQTRSTRFTFGFVRNPWDRMVSAYVFITTKTPRKADDVQHRQLATRLGFKRWLIETEFFIGNEAKDLSGSIPPFQKRSQLYWVEGCDFIGRTETINIDFQYAEAKIAKTRTIYYQLRFAGPLERRNKTTRSHYQKFYDDESHDFVAKHFAQDIALFGYSFAEAQDTFSE